MSRPVVLIIDSQSTTRIRHKERIESVCPTDIEVLTAGSAEEALGALYALRDQRRAIEMVIVNQGLPGIAGSRLLEIIHAQFPNVARLLLSEKPTLEEAIYAFNNSCVDRYVPMPWEDEDIKFTITSMLRQREMERLNERLLFDLQTRNRELTGALGNLEEMGHALERSYIQTVQSLAVALEAKDRYTAGHSQRVARFATLIARSMELGKEDVELVAQVALLHDIGKIGMLDSILNKPGNLTPEERDLVKSHPVVGAQILSPVKTFEKHVAGIRFHHEMFDGTGYPEKLRGEEIPISARIVSLADAFDAMTSTRPYRIGLPLGFALQEMLKMRGKQFCPQAVDAFARVLQASGVDEVHGLIAPSVAPGPEAAGAAPEGAAPPSAAGPALEPAPPAGFEAAPTEAAPTEAAPTGTDEKKDQAA